MPLIKRYSNRKLYNSETSQYVTLNDIAEMIRLGEDVRVIDHDTGTDLTAVTLAQVIFEQEKKIGGLLPQVIFSRLIRAGGSTLGGLREAIHTFLDPQGYIESEIRRRLDLLTNRGILSSEERQRLETLVLDPSLTQNLQGEEEEVSFEEIQLLIKKIELLEQELNELQQSQG
ncbi:MAG: polyhydroxyalkanoate synthesis regulator DNA-binding domain-containing protein [Anaerolineales bacterium]